MGKMGTMKTGLAFAGMLLASLAFAGTAFAGTALAGTALAGTALAEAMLAETAMRSGVQAAAMSDSVAAGSAVTGSQAARDEARTKARDEARELFKQAVEIPTVAGRGEVPKLIALLSERFRREGLDDIIVKPHGETASMILRWRASENIAKAGRGNGETKKAVALTAKKPILLLGHLDVVEAKRDDWADDPFVFREKDGYYWGRGTLDNKAGVLAITMSLIRLKRAGFTPERDIILLFTGDEETIGDGARLAVQEWRSLIDAEFALNSDAGGGGFTREGRALGYGIQIAEKLYRSYHFTARNRGGHSSRPRPDNAIYELSAAMTRLSQHRFTPRLNEAVRAYLTARAAQESSAQGSTPLGAAMRRWLADEHDNEAADLIEDDPKEVGMTRTRCVATRLEAGHADNALPQMARATVNCRIIPGETPATVKAELQAIAGDALIVEESDAFGTASPASPLRADVLGAYTKAVHERFPSMAIIPHMSPGATDGVFFRATGIPTYGVGGEWIIIPDDERAHGLDERIPIQSFHDNIAIWESMMRQLAG